MKKYHLKFIAFTLGIMTISLWASSFSRAGDKAGVVRISDRKQQPATTQAPQVNQTSFNQPSVASLVSSSLPGNPPCNSCSTGNCTSCESCRSNPVQQSNIFHRNLRQRKNCDECDDNCDSCRFLFYVVPHHKIAMLGQGDAGLFNRILYILHIHREEECEEEEYEGEVKYDEKGNVVKRSKSKSKRKEKHIRTGRYTKVYSVNPWHSDPRDGRVYAAKVHGVPMTVPLAPNVEHVYNYGWGVPSSRLTPVSKPPARNFVPPIPAGRYPVHVPRQHRIKTPFFQKR